MTVHNYTIRTARHVEVDCLPEIEARAAVLFTGLADRQGLGTALLEAVCSWAKARGFPAVTLSTFRDVPSDGPFYRRLASASLGMPSSHRVYRRSSKANDTKACARISA